MVCILWNCLVWSLKMLERSRSLPQSLSHAEGKQWWWNDVWNLQETSYWLLEPCQTTPNKLYSLRHYPRCPPPSRRRPRHLQKPETRKELQGNGMWKWKYVQNGCRWCLYLCVQWLRDGNKLATAALNGDNGMCQRWWQCGWCNGRLHARWRIHRNVRSCREKHSDDWFCWPNSMQVTNHFENTDGSGSGWFQHRNCV